MITLSVSIVNSSNLFNFNLSYFSVALSCFEKYIYLIQLSFISKIILSPEFTLNSKKIFRMNFFYPKPFWNII